MKNTPGPASSSQSAHVFSTPPFSALCLSLSLFRTVIDTLKTVESSRKCFRLIGGVLVEQTVEVVLPQLELNKAQLEKLIEEGKEQITKKGLEINQFKDEHNIKVRGQEPSQPAGSEKEENAADEKSSGNRNVLVGNL